MRYTIITIIALVSTFIVGCSENKSTPTNDEYHTVIRGDVRMRKVLQMDAFGYTQAYILTVDSVDYVVVRSSDGIAITPKIKK